jgi:hypothetical protein
MRHIWLALVLFAAPVGALAQEQPPAESAAPPAAAPSKIITLSGDRPDLRADSGEMAFVAGGQPRIAAQVADDIFAAGGDMRVEGASADHLILGGADIDLAPGAVKDVLAVAGRLDLRTGVISDDLVAMGGDIRLRPESRVEGSVALTGGKLRIGAPVQGELIAAGGTVEVDSAIGGDARIVGGDIVIGPSARIGGDLRIRGERVEISPQAVITGQTIREALPRHERGAEKAAAGAAVFGVLFMLGVFLVHGLIAVAAPGFVAGAAQRIRTQFLPTAGIGALAFLLSPVLLIALFASVIGAPLALFLAVAWVAVLPLAFAAISYWIGQALRGLLARGRAATPPGWGARLGWTLLGAVLVAIVFAVPFLGGVAWLVALIAGIGAAVSQLARGAPAVAAPAA